MSRADGEELIEYERREYSRKRTSTPYTKKNPPTSGMGLKIWRRLTDLGFTMYELWYNPNCWGASKNYGWGRWVCAVYIQGCEAPFVKMLAVDLVPNKMETQVQGGNEQ